MTETNSIENYITRIFSHLTDLNKRPINITLALTTLCNVIKGNIEQYSNQHYELIGETATQFAISLIISKEYSKLDHQELSTLLKKFTAVQRLNKILNQEIHLKDYVTSSYLPQAINNIIGVIYSYYGINIVEQFLKQAVLHIAHLELDEPISVKISNENENQVSKLNELIQTHQGTIDTESVEVNKLWQVKILARITPHSTLFSHQCIGASKQKAKKQVAAEILGFFQQNPTAFEQLKAATFNPQEYVLPIQDVNKKQEQVVDLKQVELENDYFHIDADEALEHLSHLLIDTNQDTRNKKRARQNNPFTVDPVTYSTTDEFNAFNQPSNDINQRASQYFSQVFVKYRSLLSSTKLHPGQAKSTFLSLVEQQKDLVCVDIKTSQGGSSHQPVFHAQTTLKSILKPSIFLTADGIANKKKDAEQAAFNRLISFIVQ